MSDCDVVVWSITLVCFWLTAGFALEAVQAALWLQFHAGIRKSVCPVDHRARCHASPPSVCSRGMTSRLTALSLLTGHDVTPHCPQSAHGAWRHASLPSVCSWSMASRLTALSLLTEHGVTPHRPQSAHGAWRYVSPPSAYSRIYTWFILAPYVNLLENCPFWATWGQNYLPWGTNLLLAQI